MERVRNERNYAWTKRGEEGREEASGGEREQRREVEEQLREDRRRKGDREGGKLQGRYPGGHWPIYNIQCKTTHNAALALETLVLKTKHSDPVCRPYCEAS